MGGVAGPAALLLLLAVTGKCKYRASFIRHNLLLQSGLLAAAPIWFNVSMSLCFYRLNFSSYRFDDRPLPL